MELKCFKATCRGIDGETYEVGVMTSDEHAAMHSAVMTLREGKHVVADAVKAERTDTI
jgi:hypothetical protein